MKKEKTKKEEKRKKRRAKQLAIKSQKPISVYVIVRLSARLKSRVRPRQYGSREPQNSSSGRVQRAPNLDSKSDPLPGTLEDLSCLAPSVYLITLALLTTPATKDQLRFSVLVITPV